MLRHVSITFNINHYICCTNRNKKSVSTRGYHPRAEEPQMQGINAMLEVVDTGINSFARVASHVDVPTSEEPVFILTSGQLEAIILQAIERATAPLMGRLEDLERKVGSGEGGEAPQDGQERLDQIHQVVQNLRVENVALKRELETFQEHVAQERAFDRQRISRLENPAKVPGKTVLSRGEKIEKYLVARPDHRATFEALKGHLGVNNVLLGDAIEALMRASPGRYTVGRIQGDKRKRVLIMLPKY